MKHKLLVFSTCMILVSLLIGCSLPSIAQAETTSALVSDVNSVDLSVDDL